MSEVGPRDGLQSIKRAMPTQAKHRWIRALAAAGLREIEVASFVPPKLMPQMADAADVVRDAVTIPGLTVLALAPNLRGAQDAIAAGAHKVTLPVSASEAHSRVQRPHDAATRPSRRCGRICEFRDALPGAARPGVEVGISTAFGCTLQGEVSEDWVMEMAVRLVKAGADSVGLSDTVGYANPVQVRRMFTRLIARDRRQGRAARTCTTRAGRASPTWSPRSTSASPPSTPRRAASAAAPTRRAPAATSSPRTSCSCSNRWASTRASTSTKLLAARKVLAEGLPGEPIYGHVPDAGLPKTFRRAAERAGA